MEYFCLLSNWPYPSIFSPLLLPLLSLLFLIQPRIPVHFPDNRPHLLPLLSHLCDQFSGVLGMTLNCIHTECVQGMTLNCIHIFIVTGSFLYWCVMRPAGQCFFIHCCIYLRILIISYLATFLGSNSLSVLMYHKAINQSISSLSPSSICFLSLQDGHWNPCTPLTFFNPKHIRWHHLLHSIHSIEFILYGNSHMAIFLIGLCVSALYKLPLTFFLHIDFQSF